MSLSRSCGAPPSSFVALLIEVTIIASGSPWASSAGKKSMSSPSSKSAKAAVAADEAAAESVGSHEMGTVAAR